MWTCISISRGEINCISLYGNTVWPNQVRERCDSTERFKQSEVFLSATISKRKMVASDEMEWSEA